MGAYITRYRYLAHQERVENAIRVFRVRQTRERKFRRPDGKEFKLTDDDIHSIYDSEADVMADGYYTADERKVLEQSLPAEVEVASLKPMSWSQGELIGCGAFGKVYLGMNNETGGLMAVKRIPLLPSNMQSENEELVSDVEHEVAMLRHLNHPNIVRYIGTSRQPHCLDVFLEYVPGGSIAKLLKRFGRFSEGVTRVYTAQILAGVEYLHRHCIMHRDIKGANILVDKNGTCKVGDFGAARSIRNMRPDGPPSLRGTPYWMAPEVIMQTGHGRQADIWSLGCTVIEMLTGHPPWHRFKNASSALFHIATTSDLPRIPGDISTGAAGFIVACLQRDPARRLNATRLKRQAFIRVVPEAATETSLISPRSTGGASAGPHSARSASAVGAPPPAAAPQGSTTLKPPPQQRPGPRRGSMSARPSSAPHTGAPHTGTSVGRRLTARSPTAVLMPTPPPGQGETALRAASPRNVVAEASPAAPAKTGVELHRPRPPARPQKKRLPERPSSSRRAGITLGRRGRDVAIPIRDAGEGGRRVGAVASVPRDRTSSVASTSASDAPLLHPGAVAREERKRRRKNHPATGEMIRSYLIRREAKRQRKRPKRPASTKTSAPDRKHPASKPNNTKGNDTKGNNTKGSKRPSGWERMNAKSSAPGTAQGDAKTKRPSSSRSRQVSRDKRPASATRSSTRVSPGTLASKKSTGRGSKVRPVSAAAENRPTFSTRTSVSRSTALNRTATRRGGGTSGGSSSSSKGSRTKGKKGSKKRDAFHMYDTKPFARSSKEKKKRRSSSTSTSLLSRVSSKSTRRRS